MKKILSLFLASLMVLSLLTGITSFASTANSQPTGDGGTLWHKFDYENNSYADKINNASTTGANLLPVVESDASGRNYGRFTVEGNKQVYLFYTSSTLGTNTDRYAVVEYDFKKDDTTYTTGTTASASPWVKFIIRDNRKNSSNYGYDTIIYQHDKEAITNWTHFIYVIDRQIDSNSQYTVNIYTKMDDTYTFIDTAKIEDREFNHFRFQLSSTQNPGKSFYIDNLELVSYGDFYTAVNSASSENISGVIEKYAALGMYGVSNDFINLTNEQKVSVAAKLLNRNFESDAQAIAALSAAMSDLVVAKKYFDWDFEDGTLNDSVNNEPFMSDLTGKPVPVLAADPVNSENNVAHFDFGQQDSNVILTYSDVIDNAAAEFDYLVIDFKVYVDKQHPLYLNFRHRNGESATKFNFIKTYPTSGAWHNYRGVVNTIDGIARSYVYTNGAWQICQIYNTNSNESVLPSTYGFFRLEIEKGGSTANTYFDDFKVTGYKSIVTELNESSVDGALNVLEVYDEIDIIDLPAAYASLDDAGKSALAQSIKSKTYTTADEINNAIKIYFSNDELVVMSTANGSDGKLASVNLHIKKSGVNAANSVFYIAAYSGNELIALTPVPYSQALATGSDVTLSGLSLDIASADEVKVIFVNNVTDITPLTKATKLK